MAANPGAAPSGISGVRDENFGDDDDELDIIAESNKQEPTRNPI